MEKHPHIEVYPLEIKTVIHELLTKFLSYEPPVKTNISMHDNLADIQITSKVDPKQIKSDLLEIADFLIENNLNIETDYLPDQNRILVGQSDTVIDYKLKIGIQPEKYETNLN